MSSVWRTSSFARLLSGFFSQMPRGVLVLDFLATVFLVCTARLAIRIYREQLRPISEEGVERVLIVGAGNAAFRVGGQEGEADTVVFGLYRREVYERVRPHYEHLRGHRLR